ncbi:hypothetical protein Cob_v011001 [Colletotrichum orbiculare MAFF 240422]|uniref:Uncharacterized protein n=1 Tax=Colletotrichum orbiculare (strain 104-T / ATCC 96160 / CBS 514.97 / LARS 414 / MAFF 240422) TaxID=1213857 RepID=A0A484FCP6_COLOR|nr:hypothetical protein Cob_v011001 [Colletotrichum orbiculare MAFF 240422]
MLVQILPQMDNPGAYSCPASHSAFGPAAGRTADDALYPSWVPDWSGIRQPGLASYDVSETSHMDKPWVHSSLKDIKRSMRICGVKKLNKTFRGA